MKQVPSAEIVKHIHERITALKTVTPVVEVEDILKTLHESYPEARLGLKDVAEYLFNAASYHDVGLVLPANVSREALAAE